MYELRQSIAKLTQNVSEVYSSVKSLELIVQRQEGYHLIHEGERITLQSQMQDLQEQGRRLEDRQNDIEPLADFAGGVVAHHSVRLHGFCNDGLGGNDGPISHLHSWHQGGPVANPHVVADDGIPFIRPVFRHGRLPAVAEDGKGVVGKPVCSVVATVHNEFHVRCNGTEPADDQLVANEVEMVEHTALKVFGVVEIVVVGSRPR